MGGFVYNKLLGLEDLRLKRGEAGRSVGEERDAK